MFIQIFEWGQDRELPGLWMYGTFPHFSFLTEWYIPRCWSSPRSTAQRLGSTPSLPPSETQSPMPDTGGQGPPGLAPLDASGQ